MCDTNIYISIASHQTLSFSLLFFNVPSSFTRSIQGDLLFGIEQGVDMVFASFIRKRQDIIDIRKENIYIYMNFQESSYTCQ